MTVLTIILLAASLAFAFSRLSGVPVIPLLLVAGVATNLLAGLSGRELPADLLRNLTEIGLAVLAFAAGIELAPRRFKQRLHSVLYLGIIQFFILGLAGMATGLILGYGWMASAYIGCALSASSTLVVVRHLQERRQMFEPFGRMVVGVLLVQDLVIILGIVLFLSLDGSWQGFLAAGGGTLLLALLALVMHLRIVPWAARKIRFDEEELLLVALAVLFAFCGLALLFDLPFLVGGFFGGFALSAFPMNGLVRGMIGSISSFFFALFFISLGAIMVLPPIPMLLHGLILVGVLLAVTIPLVTVIGEKVGLSTRVAIETSLLLSQTSEFSLILALIGVSAGHLSMELFSTIAIITVSTMTLTPFIAQDQVAWSLMRFHPRSRKSRDPSGLPTENHAVILGYGQSGPAMVQFLREANLTPVVVDDDYATIQRLREQGIPCLYGDGSEPVVLEEVHARNAKAVLCSMRKTRDARNMLRYLQGSKALKVIRTFEPSDVEILEREGAEVILTPEATAREFLKWFETNLSAD